MHEGSKEGTGFPILLLISFHGAAILPLMKEVSRPVGWIRKQHEWTSEHGLSHWYSVISCTVTHSTYVRRFRYDEGVIRAEWAAICVQAHGG